MFGVFLFVTYYLQTTLHYTPIQTGLSFLPMIGMLVLAAQLGTNLLVPRFGPKVMVPIGMLLAGDRDGAAHPARRAQRLRRRPAACR